MRMLHSFLNRRIDIIMDSKYNTMISRVVKYLPTQRHTHQRLCVWWWGGGIVKTFRDIFIP